MSRQEHVPGRNAVGWTECHRIAVVTSLHPDFNARVWKHAQLLAKPEEPETFVRATLRLLDNRELAKRLGENGRNAFLEKYTWESQEEALGDYYRSIMNSSTLVDCREVRR